MQVFRPTLLSVSTLAASMLVLGMAGLQPALARHHGGTSSGTGQTLAPSPGNEVLTGAVGEWLQKAQAALRAHNLTQAMEAVNAAQAVPGKTAYDNDTIAEMAAAVAMQAGQPEVAVRAYDMLIHSPRTTRAQKAQMLNSEIGIAYAAKNYPQVEATVARYLKEIGPSDKLETLLVQIPYSQQNWAAAVKAALAQVDAARRTGTRPPEAVLQLLASAQKALHNFSGVTAAYALSARYYPSALYWQNLLYNLASDKGLTSRLGFNLARLRLTAGLATNAATYRDLAERAVQMGLPQLALNLLDYGQAHHVLGPGSGATPAELNAQARFQAFVTQQVVKLKATLPQQVAAAQTSPAPGPALTTGYDLVLAGQAHEGLALMRTGLSRHPKHPAAALLEYGMALLDSGRVNDALKVFALVPPDTTARSLADAWTALLLTPPQTLKQVLVQPAQRSTSPHTR
ncbi:hypothetical protein [Oecophyllibacter saccharovorans]|uniref:hypothetical protein n=1 Tax=Oecophyllibacter saccharovorans TaxID=2558360 RepID=UPI001174DB24|nr:hypothetical protein [Oecophyllibacter saccharovorans]TPW35150.1 hypothetical protein E3203_06715 [Oecophyllibacter saccharovorans]